MLFNYLHSHKLILYNLKLFPQLITFFIYFFLSIIIRPCVILLLLFLCRLLLRRLYLFLLYLFLFLLQPLTSYFPSISDANVSQEHIRTFHIKGSKGQVLCSTLHRMQMRLLGFLPQPPSQKKKRSPCYYFPFLARFLCQVRQGSRFR